MTIEQERGGIVLIDRTTQSLRLLDDANLAVSRSALKIGPDSSVRVGRDSIYVLEEGRGRLFRVPIETVNQLPSLDGFTPLIDAGSPSIGELGEDGTYYMLSVDRGVLRSWKSDSAESDTTTLGSVGKRPQLTVVGSNAVVYVPENGTLVFGAGRNRTVAIDGPDVDPKTLVLQEPSEFDDSVTLATIDGGVVSIPVSGGRGEARMTKLGSAPIRPLVEASGCVLVASSSTGIYAKACLKQRGATP